MNDETAARVPPVERSVWGNMNFDIKECAVLLHVFLKDKNAQLHWTLHFQMLWKVQFSIGSSKLYCILSRMLPVYLQLVWHNYKPRSTMLGERSEAGCKMINLNWYNYSTFNTQSLSVGLGVAWKRLDIQVPIQTPVQSMVVKHLTHFAQQGKLS